MCNNNQITPIKIHTHTHVRTSGLCPLKCARETDARHHRRRVHNRNQVLESFFIFAPCATTGPPRTWQNRNSSVVKKHTKKNQIKNRVASTESAHPLKQSGLYRAVRCSNYDPLHLISYLTKILLYRSSCYRYDDSLFSNHNAIGARTNITCIFHLVRHP